jgi:site-specific recombinase XerD
MYYNSLEQEFEFKKTSFTTYKPNIGAFLEFLGERDFATVTVTDIEDYVREHKDGSESTKKNCIAHLRSLMANAVKKNINNAVDKVSKEMLIWLI